MCAQTVVAQFHHFALAILPECAVHPLASTQPILPDVPCAVSCGRIVAERTCDRRLKNGRRSLCWILAQLHLTIRLCVFVDSHSEFEVDSFVPEQMPDDAKGGHLEFDIEDHQVRALLANTALQTQLAVAADCEHSMARSQPPVPFGVLQPGFLEKLKNGFFSARPKHDADDGNRRTFELICCREPSALTGIVCRHAAVTALMWLRNLRRRNLPLGLCTPVGR